MVIRRLALPALIAATGLMVLGAVAADATTVLRTDPGGALLSGTTTIRNTSSGTAILSTQAGVVSCAQTSIFGTATTNSSATSVSGTGQLTFSTCTDTMLAVNITSCRGHGAFPKLSATSTATGGTITIGDSLARCATSATNACYYTSGLSVGTAVNATSTISFSNVPVNATTASTTDAVSAANCGTSGTFSVSLTHGVNQSNQTLTITTS
jgi:hypothetical protein